jgi:hypothetical protein
VRVPKAISVSKVVQSDLTRYLGGKLARAWEKITIEGNMKNRKTQKKAPAMATVSRSAKKQVIVATQDAIARAFTEWDRRYRKNPEEFMSQVRHLLKETPRTYGEACAPYFVQLLGELQAG